MSAPLRFDAEQLRRLHAHAEQGFPQEVVGVLAGSREAGQVSRIEPLYNERVDGRSTRDADGKIESAANRYQVSGLTLMRAEQRLEAEGLQIVGYYHSHPDHPAQYSDYDRDHALPNMSYVIVSVMEGRVETTLSWRLRDDRSCMDPEEIMRC